MANPAEPDAGRDAFLHEALLYRDDDAFLAGTVPFIRDGLDRDEAVLVVVAAPKIDALRQELDGLADGVRFSDMAEVGANPARIIPAWQRFLDDHRDRTGIRGVGEPIWTGRSANELVECQRHEALLNVAFAHSRALQLLCPYDSSALPAEVLEETERSHPYVLENGVRRRSASCRDLETMAAPCAVPLPPAPPGADTLAFARGNLPAVRQLVAAVAERAGLDPVRSAEFCLAAHELATNSVRHGGGEGVLALWCADESLMCEIRDQGEVDDPLAGRRQPSEGDRGGRGLWIANQVCDLVQIRALDGGTQIRLHLTL